MNRDNPPQNDIKKNYYKCVHAQQHKSSVLQYLG